MPSAFDDTAATGSPIGPPTRMSSKQLRRNKALKTHEEDAIHPKFIFSRYGFLDGSAFERFIQLFFSYHYFFVLAIVWATTLNVILQTTFVSFIPAAVQAPSIARTFGYYNSTTSADLTEDGSSDPTYFKFTVFIGEALSYLLLCTSVAYLGVRVMTIIGDAMVVDGWWSRGDRQSTYHVRLWEQNMGGSKLQLFSLVLCASLFGVSAVQLLQPLLSVVPTFGLACKIAAVQAGAASIIVLCNIPSVLLLGRRWDDVGERLFFYLWVYLRWSTFFLLIGIFFSRVAAGALWQGFSDLVSCTILLIVPHVLVLVVAKTHGTLWNALTLFSILVSTAGRRSKRNSKFGGVLKVVADFAPIAVGVGVVGVASQWFLRSHGWLSLCAVGYSGITLFAKYFKQLVANSAVLSREEDGGSEDPHSPSSPLGARQVSNILDDIPRRRFVHTLVKFLGILSVVIIYAVIAAVLHQHHEDAPPLAIQEYNKESGVLVTEHLRVVPFATDDAKKGGGRAEKREEDAGDDEKIETRLPAFCKFREMGLSFVDFAWFSFLPYFRQNHPNFAAVFDTYSNNRKLTEKPTRGPFESRDAGNKAKVREDPGDDWALEVHSGDITDKDLLESRVVFMELFSASRNTSLVLVRGTDVNNRHDILQDFTLFLEVGLFQLLAFFVPGFQSLPDQVIADIIGATSLITRLMDPERMYYFSALTKYVSKLKQKRKQVVLCGHSLGGALAQIAAIQNDLPVVAISSPGIVLSSKKFDLDMRRAFHNVVNLNPDYDVASRVDKPAGTIFNIPCKAQRPDRCHLLEITLATLWEECPNLREEFHWESLELVTKHDEWK